MPVTAVAAREVFRSDEGWIMDARYWWEVPPVAPYQREQIREIMTLVLDRYFGIDISGMSPEEFEGVAKSLGPEGEWGVLRLFGYYAQKKGFEVPAGIFDAPPGFDEPSGIPTRIETSPDGYTPGGIYWWKVMGGGPEEGVEELIAEIAERREMSPDEVRTRFGELFPGVDLWKMTFGEYADFLNSLPPPPIEPTCLERAKQSPYTIAIFGKMPPLYTQDALREFREKLDGVVKEVIEPFPSPVRDLVECNIMITTTCDGVIRIGIYGDHVANAEEVYEVISEKAKSLFGIEDVPVIISGGTRGETLELALEGTAFSSWPPPPPYGDRYRPIVGGIAKTALYVNTLTGGRGQPQALQLWNEYGGGGITKITL